MRPEVSEQTNEELILAFLIDSGEEFTSGEVLSDKLGFRRTAGDPSAATIAIFTHRAREVDVQAAVKWIDGIESTRAPTRLIRIEEGE